MAQRRRYNNAVGTTGASLSSSGTTINFGATAPPFSTLSGGDFIPLILEPTGSVVSANFEVVYLTAYTAAATTGTISRGQEGTTGVAHANGVAWACGPLVEDFPTGAFTSGDLLQANSLGQPTDSGVATASVVTVSSGTPSSGQFAQFNGTGNEVIPVAAPSASTQAAALPDLAQRYPAATGRALSSGWNTLNTARCDVYQSGTLAEVAFEATANGSYGANVFTRDTAYAIWHQPNLLSAAWRRAFVVNRLAQRSTTSDPDPNGGTLPANFIAQYITSTGTRQFMNTGYYLPDLDGIAFVILALWTDWVETGDNSTFLAHQTVINTCLSVLPRDPSNANGCIYSDPSNPSADYGFTDSVLKTGLCTYGSALLARAYRQCADMAGETAPGPVGTYTTAYLNVVAALRALRDTDGWYMGSSVNNSAVHDTWATALIAAEGLCSQTEQLASAELIVDEYQARSGWVVNGIVQHLLPGETWVNCSDTAGTAQNGGFWFTPLRDILRCVQFANPRVANSWVSELIRGWQLHITAAGVNTAPYEFYNYNSSGHGGAGQIEAASFLCRLAQQSTTVEELTVGTPGSWVGTSGAPTLVANNGFSYSSGDHAEEYSTTTDGGYAIFADTSTVNQTVQAVLECTTLHAAPGLILRYTDANNYIFCEPTGVGLTNINIFQRVAGTNTSLATIALPAAITASTQFTAEAAVNGTTVTFTCGGITLTATTTISSGLGVGVRGGSDGSAGTTKCFSIEWMDNQLVPPGFAVIDDVTMWTPGSITGFTSGEVRLIDPSGELNGVIATGGTPNLVLASLETGADVIGVTSVFARAGVVAATSGDYTVGQVTGAAPIASPTFTGTTTAPEFSASGLTGATAASRYVGATTSGAPGSGTFAKGDFVIDQSGAFWICTTAGSPGTWTEVVTGSSTSLEVTDGTTTVTGVTEINVTSGGTVSSGGSGIADLAISGSGSSPVAARAYRNAALTLASGTVTKVPVDTLNFDTASNMDVATNHRYNVPTTGYYQVSGQLGLPGGVTCQAILYVNGSDVLNGAAGSINAVVVSGCLKCTAGDYIELWAYAAGSAALGGGVAAANYLSVAQFH